MKKSISVSNFKIKFLLTVCIIFLLSVFFFKIFVSANSSNETVPTYKYYTSVCIQRGDTLWNIAEQYCPEAISMNHYVEELKKINHLDHDEIHSGNYLTIVYYSDEKK